MATTTQTSPLIRTDLWHELVERDGAAQFARSLKAVFQLIDSRGRIARAA